MALVLVLQVVVIGSPLSATRNARAAPPPDLRIGFLQTIDSLNPFQGVNDPSYLLYGLIYDYPYAFDQDGNWISNLITSSSCAKADCSVWNYTVRQGVYWQDPQNPTVQNQMTAADVAFTWNYDSQNLSFVWAYEPYFNQVVQCTKTNVGHCGAVISGNGWNVTVFFNRPFAAGEDLFGPIVQEAQWQGISPGGNANYNNADPIGTGPFIADPNIYSEFQALPTVPIHLTKNPHYHEVGGSTPNIRIDNIYLYVFTDVTQLTLAIENGDIDLAAFTPSTIGPLRTQPNIQVQAALQAIQEWNEIGISQCDSNHAMAQNNPARFDTRVRQALAKATNKDYILKYIYDSQGLRGDSLVSPITPQWWYDPTAPGGNNLTFDVTAAKAILAADGWTSTWSDSTGTYLTNPNPITVSYQSGNSANYQVENIANTTLIIPAGTRLSFSLAVRPPAEFPEEYTTAQYLMEQWAQIGVKITIIQESTENALQNDVYKCNVDMYIWYWSADPDPNYMLSMESSWTLDGWNDNFWVNTSYNRLYLKQLADLNETQRETDAKAAQAIQYASASYIIYIFPFGEWAMRTDLWQGWGDWNAHPYRQMNAYWGANPLFFDLNCPSCGTGPINQPPTPPVINYPTYSYWTVGDNLTLTATSSDAESYDGLNWTWAWGDGNYTVTHGTAANPTSTAGHVWTTPKNYTVTVSVSDGLHPANATNNPIHVNVTAPLAIKGWLAGTVKDSAGIPLAGAVVTTTPGNRASSTTGATGTYNITLAPGSYSATATAPFYFDQTKGPFTITENATTPMDFGLVSNKGWITGTVTNSNGGAAISGAYVVVQDKATGNKLSNSTNANGQFNISVEPGTFYVNVTATGFKPASQNATVQAGQATTVTFSLVPLPGNQVDLMPLILGAVGIIAVVAIVAVALIFMRRRKKKEEEEAKIELPPKT